MKFRVILSNNIFYLSHFQNQKITNLHVYVTPYPRFGLDYKFSHKSEIGRIPFKHLTLEGTQRRNLQEISSNKVSNLFLLQIGNEHASLHEIIFIFFH